jgi:type IV pilus secretin PilQ/predicted competence protein
MIPSYDNEGKKLSLDIGENRISGMARFLIRIGLALGLGLSACVTPVSQEATVSQGWVPLRNNAPADSSAASPKSATLDAKLLALEDFSVREESGQTTLLLKFSKPISQYRHFPLTQPSRIIVDLFENAAVPADMSSFRVGTDVVATVRFSSGQGLLRISVDAISSEPPVYSLSPADGGIKIIVGNSDLKKTATRDLTLIRGGRRMAPQERSMSSESLGAGLAGGSTTGELKKYNGQKISFDFKDADIKSVFRLLAEVSGLNIIVTSDVNRRVTLRLVEVPWDQAMDLLIDTNGLGKEQVGNVVRISTAAALKAERDALAAAKKSEENLEALQTAYFNVNYAKVKDLEAKIKTVLSKRPDTSLVIDERSNVIMVRDVRKVLEDVSTLVAKLDTRTPQVLIESNLIETTPSFARAFGNRLTFQLGGTTFSSASPASAPFVGSTTTFPNVPDGLGATVSVIQRSLGGIKNLANALEAAENEGNIKIISRPSVVTLNNQASTIRSERILRILLPSSTNIATGSGSSAAGAAVATEKVPVGIVLTVTPQVSSDGYILMNINVKSSSIADSSLGGGGAVVNFDELNREAVANVLVRDGDTIVLGGILKDTAQNSEAGLPYLKDIPVFGWLFKRHLWQKNFEELMVFITPRITEVGAINLPTAEQIWRDQMRSTYGDRSGPSMINP